MENLSEIIEKIGVENITFLVPCRPVRTAFGLIAYTSSEDKEQTIPCTICEDRYKVKDNYKITLKPIYLGWESHSFYISDLEHMIDDKRVKMMITYKSSTRDSFALSHKLPYKE